MAIVMASSTKTTLVLAKMMIMMISMSRIHVTQVLDILINNVTTLTTFEALGNVKSQTPKLSHTLINSVAIQPYAIQHPLCQLAAKHDNNFVGFQHFCLCVSDDPFSTYPGQVQGSKLVKESVTQQIWIMLVDVFKTKVKSQCVD
jgi:hypothetical protein